MPYVKVPETVISVIETDVVELARDPEGHGLSREETMAYRALARSFDRGWGRVEGPEGVRYPKGGRLKVPSSLPDQKKVAALLLDLSNSYDAQAEEGRGDKAFDRRASNALSATAIRLNKLIYGEDLPGGFRLRKDGSKHHLYRGEHLVLKFPSKRSAVAVAEMGQRRRADRDRMRVALSDLYKEAKKSGIPKPEENANDVFVHAAQRAGIPHPDWYREERMVLMGVEKPVEDVDAVMMEAFGFGSDT